MKHIYVMLIVPSTILVPIGAALFKRSYRLPVLSIIFQYLLLAAGTEIAARILGSRSINNLPLLHFYTMFELLILLLFFRKLFEQHRIRRLINVLMIAFPLLCVGNFLFIQSILQYNSYPRPIAAVIIIGFCMMYFYKRLDINLHTGWTRQPINWMVSGLLVYFSSSLLHFAFLNLLYQKADRSVYFLFGNIHATLVMVMYLLFAVGFLITGKDDR